MDGVTPLDFDIESASTDELFVVVYDELKRMARHHLRSNEPSTLCTTELVHEAFLKLSRGNEVEWNGRAHFFGAASRAMRQIMVDLARRRRTHKRGSQPTLVSLSEAESADGSMYVELDGILALDAALDELDRADKRLRHVVELRLFGGLEAVDIARVLGVGLRTVERDWFKARLFLLRELEMHGT